MLLRSWFGTACRGFNASFWAPFSAVIFGAAVQTQAATFHWKGGDGLWNFSEAMWSHELGETAWANANLASFGSAPADFIGGGVVHLGSSLSQVAGLHFAQRTNLETHYRLSSDPALVSGTPFTLTLSASDVTLAGSGYGELQDLELFRSGSLNIRGTSGGTLLLSSGSQLRSTGYSSIVGGATVVVETGAQWSSGDTFLVGTTVTNDTVGDAHLIVNGGVVTSGVSTGSRNFILGNRNGKAGSVSVTLNSGEIRVHENASTGLSFENLDTVAGQSVIPSHATFHLNGGVLSARRILSSNNSGNPNASVTGETLFNFNGGTWKIVNPLADQNITVVDRIKYVVKSGGAIIDTNGFSVLSRASFYTDATLNGQADGGLTKLGQGKLTLAGDNFFTGDLSIREGGVIAFSETRLGAARKIQIYGGASLENTTASYEMRASRSVELGGDATWMVNGSTTIIFKGAIHNLAGQTGRLVKAGTGTLDLRDGEQSSYSGGVSITGGTLLTNSLRQLGSTTGQIHIDGGTFNHQTSEVLLNAFVIGTNGAKIGGNAWNGRGLFTGSGHLQVEGTVVLGGKNVNLSSAIEVLAGGNLGLRQASAMGNTVGGVTLRNNAILRLDHNGVGGSGFDVNDRYYKDALVMQSGSQLWSLGRASANESAASAAVYQGSISLTGGNLVRFHVFNQASNFASLEVPDLEIAGVISGAGGFEKVGAGKLVLHQSNTFTGKVQLSAGKVELRDAQALGSSAWIQVGAATTLDVSNLPQWQVKQKLSGEGTLRGTIVVADLGQLSPGGNTATQDASLAGSDLGTLNVEGDLKLLGQPSHALRLQLGAGASDRIVISGALTVGQGVKIEVLWAEGLGEIQGQTYDLLDWNGMSEWNQFDVAQQLILPSLNFLPGSSWDTSQFLSQGVLRVVPEPTCGLLLGVAGFGMMLRRRRQS